MKSRLKKRLINLKIQNNAKMKVENNKGNNEENSQKPQ